MCNNRSKRKREEESVNKNKKKRERDTTKLISKVKEGRVSSRDQEMKVCDFEEDRGIKCKMEQEKEKKKKDEMVGEKMEEKKRNKSFDRRNRYEEHTESKERVTVRKRLKTQ